jgi:hypothetical protein
VDDVETTELDLRDTETNEVDLKNRLRFAADSLAADFAELTADRAEALVFSSAEGLLASARVTDFVPIFAERRARRAVRAGTAPAATQPAATPPPPAPASAPLAAPPPTPAPAPAPPPPAPAPAPSPPATSRTASTGRPPALAVSGDEMARLRDGVEQLKERLSYWQADLTRR